MRKPAPEGAPNLPVEIVRDGRGKVLKDYGYTPGLKAVNSHLLSTHRYQLHCGTSGLVLEIRQSCIKVVYHSQRICAGRKTKQRANPTHTHCRCESHKQPSPTTN